MVCTSRYVMKISTYQFDEMPAAVKELSRFIDMVVSYSNDVCSIFSRDLVFAQLDTLLEQFIGD